MGVFKKNGWWWIDYYDTDGRRHRERASLEHRIAKDKLKDKLGCIARGDITGIREEGVLFRDFVEKKYWPTVKESLSEHEQRRARCTIDQHLLPRFGGSRLNKIRQEDIERFQAERLGKVAPGTVRKDVMRLKHILNRAANWHYLKHSPARGIQQVATPPGRTRYLMIDERHLLLDRARPDLRLYIAVALQTAGRRGELCGLKWSDVDMKTRTVSFSKTKNGERRVIPMTETLREILNQLPRPLNPDAPVLPPLSPDAVTLGFRRLVSELGIKDFNFHDLRHDVASTLTMASVPQRTIMEILGHRDPRMTLRYQHLSPEHFHDAMKVLDRVSATTSKAETRSENSAG